MTGDLDEHAPAPLPLIARYYESLGFSTPGTEYDPETGTYQPQPGPRLPDAADVQQARQAWRDGLEVVAPLAELQRIALESEQTDRAYARAMHREAEAS